MAFLEWRRFKFFDVIPDVDQSKLNECLKDKTIECASNGCGYIVLGDNDGNIHLVSHSFSVKTFRAFLVRVCLVEQAKHAPILVTIGDDEGGINPHLKVWKLDKTDKNGDPTCVRMCRAIPGSNPVQATVLCVHENLSLLAVGYTDGSIVLHRGDITRDRSVKKTVLKDNRQSITGLAFRSTAKMTYLYACTHASVFVFDVSVKDKEQKVELDDFGCKMNCSTLADSTQSSHFMVGIDTAVYCYTPDGKGPCYAVEGSKVLLQWFRKWNYLVIVSIDNQVRASTASPVTESGETAVSDSHVVTILDIQNMFIVLSTPIKNVKAVLAEWGSLYVLTGGSRAGTPAGSQGNHALYHLREKDLQTKLTMLFKKNLYDVSIRIARSHQYDLDGLAEIFKQYGDHLYLKGDHAGAIEQYVKTIGRLEPSYVIRKFLDSQHIENLTTYLQELHKQGAATEDHTTLLLNCYTKLDKTDKLKEFIMTKDREVDFDVEVAIKVCRQASPDDALMLAEKHHKHDWYLKIQTEDNGRFQDALQYITKLEFEEAERNMIKYGGALLANVPHETTEFLKKLCTKYEPADKSLIEKAKTVPDQADPDNFIHLFSTCPDRLQDYLEYLLKENTKSHSVVFKTLLEHYLSSWNALDDPGAVNISKRHHYEQAAMRLLKEADSSLSRDQLLILCQAHNFKAGIIHLLEENRMYQQIIQYHMRQLDLKSVLSCCRKYGQQDPSLWVQALWFCARDSSTPSNVLEEILKVIEKEKSMPPLLVLDALCNSPDVSLATVRSYLLSVLQAENELMQSEQNSVKKYREESQRARDQIQQIQTSAMVFQLSRCSICKHPLELPSIHFLCLHSFHQHCFQSYSENENECLTCLPSNKIILDRVKSQKQDKKLHETFHDLLDKADDGFSHVAMYFGRGLFNRFTVPDVLPKKHPTALGNASLTSAVQSSKPHVKGSGPRLGEGSAFIPSASPKLDRDTSMSTSPAYSKNAPAVAAPERHTATESKESKPEKKQPNPSGKASKDEVYDEKKNPFHEDSGNPFSEDSGNPFSEDSGNPFSEDSGNPFGEDSDTDYDPRLNPFSE